MKLIISVPIFEFTTSPMAIPTSGPLWGHVVWISDLHCKLALFYLFLEWTCSLKLLLFEFEMCSDARIIYIEEIVSDDPRLEEVPVGVRLRKMLHTYNRQFWMEKKLTDLSSGTSRILRAWVIDWDHHHHRHQPLSDHRQPWRRRILWIHQCPIIRNPTRVRSFLIPGGSR